MGSSICLSDKGAHNATKEIVEDADDEGKCECDDDNDERVGNRGVCRWPRDMLEFGANVFEILQHSFGIKKPLQGLDAESIACPQNRSSEEKAREAFASRGPYKKNFSTPGSPGSPSRTGARSP